MADAPCLGSARVSACDFRRPAGKPIRRDAPAAAWQPPDEDAYAPQHFRLVFRSDCILDGTIKASGWRLSTSATHSFRAPHPSFGVPAFIGFDDLKDGTKFGGFQLLVSTGKCERKAFRHGKPGAAQILREFATL